MSILASRTTSAAATPDAKEQLENSSAPPVRTLISPPRGWQLINVRELWQFRDLLYFLTWRDVKVRYKQTVLGAAWAILQPLLMMVVFTIFFARMAGVRFEGPSYVLFAYTGLLPWTFFSTAVANAGNSIIGSERLITKIYFPRLAIPFSAVAAAVVDFVIAMSLLVGMMLYYGVMPGPRLLLIPLIYAVIVLAALGMGTLLAALNAAYRDFRYVIPFLLQVWMFATPSIYMTVEAKAHGSSWIGTLITLNPLTSLISAFRAAVLGTPLDWVPLGISTLLVLGLFLVGCFYFRKVEDNFADVI